jgi:hypothetical protein
MHNSADEGQRPSDSRLVPRFADVAPAYDSANITSHLAASLMFELLCVLALAVARRQGQSGG